MTICAWSPELDPHGNSVVAQRILQHLVKQIRASVY
jgi:glutaminase